MLDPELTVMHQPTRSLGQCAAQLIVEQIQGKKVPPMEPVDLQLIARESTQVCQPQQMQRVNDLLARKKDA
jgi:DNA-binding LacI/PurR family transcriptional regulator